MSLISRVLVFSSLLFFSYSFAKPPLYPFIVGEHVLVYSDHITLFDLVDDKSSLTNEERIDFQSIEIGRAPSLSSSLRLKRKRIENLLSSRGLVGFDVPEEISVKRASMTLKNQQVSKVIEEYIKAQLLEMGLRDKDVEISVKLSGADLKIPWANDIIVNVSHLQPKLPVELTHVWVDIRTNQSLLRTIRVPVALTLNETVWIAGGSIAKGSKLSRKVLTKKVVNNIRHEFLKVDHPFDDLYFQNDVISGQEIRKSDLGLRLPILEGRWYIAQMQVAKVIVFVRVKALISTDGHKEFQAVRENGATLTVKMDGEGVLWISS